MICIGGSSSKQLYKKKLKNILGSIKLLKRNLVIYYNMQTSEKSITLNNLDGKGFIMLNSKAEYSLAYSNCLVIINLRVSKLATKQAHNVKPVLV